MTSLLSLAERCEAATGPDRELDGEIALASGWTFVKMKGDAQPYWRKPGVTDYFSRERSGPPRYTESLDSALTLVPEGMEWLVRTPSKNAISNKTQFYANVGNQVGEAHAETAALALCAAALKARAEMDREARK